MSNFAQKHTKIATFYLLTPGSPKMKEELIHHSRWKKTVLVIPVLATEFTDPDNRPVFENILDELRGAPYISRILFGLDAATEEEARELWALVRRKGLQNSLIVHNDGPGFRGIYDQLSQAGFALTCGVRAATCSFPSGSPWPWAPRPSPCWTPISAPSPAISWTGSSIRSRS